MSGCQPLSLDGAFLGTMLGHVDCQAQAIGEYGYAALAAPGSAVSLTLTAVLTIFVALFGYRLLTGRIPDVRDGVVAAVKLGAVLVLATSWPAFRTLAYDVTMHGPAEIAATIGQPTGLPGAGGGLVARLQGVDDALVELVRVGAGRPPSDDLVVSPTEPMTDQQRADLQRRLAEIQQRPTWDPTRDATLLGYGRTLYLTGAIAAFASVRIVAGLLLALGPLFALFLLFDATRGLWEGWVRGLAGAALGALATAIVLGVELALMESWLLSILATRQAGISTPSVPVELLVVTLVFAVTLIAVLGAVAWVARGFQFPLAWRDGAARLVQSGHGTPVVAVAGERGGDGTMGQDRARALAVADAVAATQRREQASGSANPTNASDRGYARAPGTAMTARDMPATTPPPLGQSYQRRTQGRVSAGARRRDRGA